MPDVTMFDVAREAGVGVATVDRVINRRARVRAETAARVLAAAEKIGFNRIGLIRKRIDEDTSSFRLGFILQKTTAFYGELGEALLEAAKSTAIPLGKSSIIYLEDLTPSSIVSTLLKMSEKVDAIAVVAADHPLINKTVSDLKRKGVPVFALISDLSGNDSAGYVSVDHRMMGRTAAWTMINRLPQGGKLGLMIGSHRYLCQEQAEISFRSYLREHAPQFDVLETMMNLEDSRLAESATLELLSQHKDLKGIYIAGGGVEGVVQALTSHTPNKHPLKDKSGEFTTICHDLTAHSRQALIDGYITMVLSHPNKWMATSLIEAMIGAIRTPGNKGRHHVVLPHITYTSANV